MISFTATLISKYKTAIRKPDGTKEDGHTLKVYRLGTEDLDFLKQLDKKIDSDEFISHKTEGINPLILKENTKEAITDAINFIEFEKFPGLKIKAITDIFVACFNDKPCGLLVGNLPKVRAKEGISYSNRDVKGETELDWMSTWCLSDGSRPSATGPALISEFFQHCKKLKKIGIDRIYLRSELPEYSPAMKFYQGLGFKQLSDKPIPMDNENRPVKITRTLFKNEHPLDSSGVFPMIIDIEDTDKAILSINKKFHRKKALKKTKTTLNAEI